MKTIRALWAQRMKWQAGTVEDLLLLGINRLTLGDWWMQGLGMFNVFFRLLWIFVIVVSIAFGSFQITLLSWLLPFVCVALDVKRAFRIPHRDRIDLIIAATFFPQELFMWLRSGWLVASWWAVLTQKITRRRVDRWGAQYEAEEVN